MSQPDPFRRARLNVLGLNSGTSINSLDWALVEFGGTRPTWRVLNSGELKFPGDLAKRLRTLAGTDVVAKSDLAATDQEFGIWVGDAVRRIRSRHLRGRRVDLVASHGQTVGHWPGGAIDTTLQIGDPDQIAKRAGIPVVSHFRHGDLAVGGQGAPLTPAVNRMLFGRARRTVGILNLGGIANLSVIPPRSSTSRALGTDCGPANLLLDAAARMWLRRPLDRGGRVAGRGTVHAGLLGTLTRHSWFRKRLPASCGREQFGEAFLREVRRSHPRVPVADVLATLCAYSAWGVARAVWKLSRQPDIIYLTGGGVHNAALVTAIDQTLGAIRVAIIEELGVDPDALEAVSFALLGYLMVRRRPVDLRGATGARRAAVLGRLVWP